MLLLIKSNDTVVVDQEDVQVVVPDIKVPQDVAWSVSVLIPGKAVLFYFTKNKKHWTALLWGSVVLGADTWWVVQTQRGVATKLKAQLGDANVGRLINAVRNSSAVRQKLKEVRQQLGVFKLIKNSADQVVGVMPPHVMAGTNPASLCFVDEDLVEDPETAPEVVGLE